jgi:hypothetical protein
LDLVAANNVDNTISILLQSAAVSLSSNSLDFGNQAVGTTSSPQNVTLTNAGTGNLSITSIAVTGANAGDFGQTNTCGTSVAPGATCTIMVTFTPTTTGSRSGSITITDNASDSPQTISLTGMGVTPMVSLSPTSLIFKAQLVNTTSAAQVVTLMNTGTATLTINSVSITGRNVTDFAQTNTCGTSVPAGGSCTFNVTFTPTTINIRQANLSISDNATGSPQTVSLSGIGTVVQLNPTKLTFGNVQVGMSSQMPITLTNIATQNLPITSIKITGTNTSDYSQTNTCPTILPAGQSCTITVTFAPTTTGTRTANVSVTDNGGGSPQLVALTGSGT